MKIKSLLLAFVLLSGFKTFAQDKKLDNIGNANTNQANFKFNEEEYNFGTIKQGESVTHDFQFTNTGSEPLIINKAEGSCGCTVPTYPQQPILKGQTAVIKVTFNSTGKSGIQDKTVTLTSNAIQNPTILHIKGTVEKPIEQPAADQPKN
jgi:hypothetical protein